MFLTVEAVVDSVNNVVRRRRGGGEAAFVLLDQVLFCSGESGDAVHFRYTLVRSVASDLSSNSRVKTRHLQVHAYIGVVDINDAGSTQVANILVVTDGVGGRGKGRKSRYNSCLRQEITTFSGKLRGRSLNVAAGHKGSNGAGTDRQKGTKLVQPKRNTTLEEVFTNVRYTDSRYLQSTIPRVPGHERTSKNTAPS
jgi:hypothetical protein